MHYAVGLIENGRSEKKRWGLVHYEGAWANSKADFTERPFRVITQSNSWGVCLEQMHCLIIRWKARCTVLGKQLKGIDGSSQQLQKAF